jgi:thiamine-phosphate pyrophosphorylase
MTKPDRIDRAAIARIMDANANRAAEGVRVIEEIVRFWIGDAALTARLKDLRHEIRSAAAAAAAGAVAHRDAAADVGAASATASELSRGSIGIVARANFSRAEEALRVLEEFGKLLDADASRRFKHLRFALYSIERIFFLEGGAAAGAMPERPFLYPILDRALVAAADVAAAAEALVAGGAGIVQYRAKGVPRDEMRRDLVSVIAAARPAAVPVIVNDDVELAVETGADGAHVGAADVSPEEARAMLGPGAILGVTANDVEGIAKAPAGAASYVAVGPVFASEIKPEVPAVGLDAVRRARSLAKTPLVAIGGITPANAASVIAAGADGIAVVSAVLAGDIRKNCFTFLGIIGTKRECG